MTITTYPLIITLDVNGLYAPIKVHRNVTHFRSKYIHRLKVRWWRNVFHANGNQKKTGVAILISDTRDLKPKTIMRAKERHHIMIKGSTQEEDIIIGNIYAPNIGAPTYNKQILTDIKGKSASNTIMVGDFNTPLTIMERKSR